MRILHVGKFYYPYMGGIETVLRSMAEGLIGRGHKVTVLCASTSRSSETTSIGGVDVIRMPNFGSLMSQPFTPGLVPALRQLVRQHDVVHVHSPNPLAEVATLLAAHDTPLIVTYHSDIVRQKLAAHLYAPLARSFLHRVEAIVAATEFHIQHSPLLSSVSEKCRVVPFGLDDNAFRATPAALERAAALRSRYGRHALFVGRLVGYKGVDVLLTAMAGADASLVVIGQGPLQASLERQAREWKIADRTHFLGRVDDGEEFLAHLLACEVFVLPSVTRAEAFGMVLLEAMACGKPVITTKLDSGVRFVNEDGVTGIQVEPNDPLGLGQALNLLFADDDLRKRMGEAARRRFLRHFTLSRMLDGYEEVYLDVAGGRKRLNAKRMSA